MPYIADERLSNRSRLHRSHFRPFVTEGMIRNSSDTPSTFLSLREEVREMELKKKKEQEEEYPIITNEELTVILSQGFVTGSCAVGLQGEHSDLDIVVREASMEILGADLSNIPIDNHYEGGGFTSYKLRLGVREQGEPCLLSKNNNPQEKLLSYGVNIINLIVCKDEKEYQKWEVCTKLLKTLPLRKIDTKEKRAFVFSLVPKVFSILKFKGPIGF